MRDYRGLQVWQKAHALALEVNAVVTRMSREHASLRTQMRRSAESIPTNIVEGCARPSQKQFANFLHISVASCSELEYQLQLAHDYKAIDASTWRRLTDLTV